MNTNKMKLSEAIRAAVDKHLNNGKEPIVNQSYTLAAALVMGNIDSSFATDVMPADSFFWSIYGTVQEYKQLQAVRFMYAEFLALEQEDIEAADDFIHNTLGIKDVVESLNEVKKELE